MTQVMDRFLLKGKICIITGGGGFLGEKHAEAVLAAGGIPILLDINKDSLQRTEKNLLQRFPDAELMCFESDVTNKSSLIKIKDVVVQKYQHIDVLINNAANNPKVESVSANLGSIKFENLPIGIWQEDMAVGLTGAFICAQVFGEQMVSQKSGVVLNISSDLGIIAPDQRIYRKENLSEEEQTIKPVTYSVIKHGLIGLTKYLATYWAEKGIRVNAICPAGVENGQGQEFIEKLTNLIPLGRMADSEEYQCTVIYMISQASSYMTGATVIVDGGRSCW